MERDRIVTALKAMQRSEEFTATRVGTPGCLVRREAADRAEVLGEAVRLLQAENTDAR